MPLSAQARVVGVDVPAGGAGGWHRGRAPVRDVVFSAGRELFPQDPVLCTCSLPGELTCLSSLPHSRQAATVLQAAFRGHLARVKLLSSQAHASESPGPPSSPSQVTLGGQTQRGRYLPSLRVPSRAPSAGAAQHRSVPVLPGALLSWGPCGAWRRSPWCRCRMDLTPGATLLGGAHALGSMPGSQ